MIDHLIPLAIRQNRQSQLVAIEQLRVMLNLDRLACFPPIYAHGSNAMRANAKQFHDFALSNGFEVVDVLPGQRREEQIVAQPARRIAIALLFLQNSKRNSEML